MSWEELNKRQQAYLKTIYEVDQETEASEKSVVIKTLYKPTP